MQKVLKIVFLSLLIIKILNKELWVLFVFSFTEKPIIWVFLLFSLFLTFVFGVIVIEYGDRLTLGEFVFCVLFCFLLIFLYNNFRF